MADSKIDTLDVGALERSVNDSAGRVSGIWLSFVAFSAYLAAAASMISHRQIFLEEPIKLPTINIDLPLLASAILLPLLYVIYHVYVLLQVVLLARTADAYNEAVAHSVPESADSTRLRQRLANTLFAQLFAGSPREREGVLGWLLRMMAWVTLAIAPVCVLLVFEIKFLPFHSLPVTWTHRILIAADLVAVLLLWAGAVDPRRDISWRSLIARPWILLAGAACLVLWWSLVTIPGEPTRALMRMVGPTDTSDRNHPDCWAPKLIALMISDSLRLQGEDFVDDEKLAKIVATAKANRQPPRKSERTRNFRGRDLRCGLLAGTDLRRADFSGANLIGASFRGAHLDGTVFSGARLQQTVFDAAQLQAAYFAAEDDDNVKNREELLKPAELAGASFAEAQLQGCAVERWRGCTAHTSRAPTWTLPRLQGATLRSARLPAVMMVSAQVGGASFSEAKMHGAVLGSVDFQGAELRRAFLQGARFDNARLTLADFSDAFLWHATRARCNDAQVSTPDLDAFLDFAVVGRRRGRGGETVKIKPEPDALDKFIDQASASVPASTADQLRARLKERLSLQASSPQAEQSEKDWSKCADEAVELEAYRQKRVVLLVRLVCEADTNGKYIAEGLYRNMGGLMGVTHGRTFARALLGLDGKPCSGLKDLDETVRLELVKAATD